MPIKRIQGDQEGNQDVYYEYDTNSTPLGRGGMGVVYRGVRVDIKTGLRSDVAIKTLYPDLSEEIYERAKREGSIRIKHVNLVEMYGLITQTEVSKTGKPVKCHYLISELLKGVDLSDLLNGKVDNNDGSENPYARQLLSNYKADKIATAIIIMRNICSGVMSLHDNGFIHRDIDPTNIMVTSDGAVKLIDYGIAKNLNTLDGSDKLTTISGVFIGKAEYASPELVLGDVEHQNFTTDVYALGILFYKLVTGELPFHGTRYDILEAQLKKNIPIGRIHNKKIAKIIRKATEKTQSHRYQTIASFRAALDEEQMQDRKSFKLTKWKILLMIFLVICSYALYQIFRPSPPPTPDDDHLLKFRTALTLLDNENPDSVKEGFEMMKSLTRNGYESGVINKAKIEIGLTYNPYPVNNSKDARSRLILERRKSLGLKDFDNSEADSSIEYLNSVSYLPPEALYVLGMVTYELHIDKEKTLHYFYEANRKLQNGVEAGHEYDSKELSRKLINNINALNNSD